MELDLSKILVIAIAAILLITLLFGLMQPPKEDILSILERQLTAAEIDLGKSNSFQELKLTGSLNFSGETFDTQNRSVSFSCNSGIYCCFKNEKCGKPIEWSERNFSVKSGQPVTSSARCYNENNFNSCKIYFGTEPAQLEIVKTGFRQKMDLKESSLQKISVEMKNSGKTPSLAGTVSAKIYRETIAGNAAQKQFVIEKKAKIESIQPEQKFSASIEIEIPSDGNYFAEIKASAEDAGFDSNKIYFNVTDSRPSGCHITETDDTIAWNSETENCRQKFYCENCKYAFDCKDLWEKEAKTALKAGDSTFAFLEMQCETPDNFLLPPNETGLETKTPATTPNIGGKTIVLDPGHGPANKATGGCSTHNPPQYGITEDSMALDISIKLKKLLEESGAKVLMTRNAETNPGCRKRADVANNSKADLFVSIHTNAGGGSGSETFYDADGKFLSESSKLAKLFEQKLSNATGLKSRGAKPDTLTKVKSLGVFSNNHSTPAVLTEPLFLDNKTENDKIKNPAFRQKIAQAIFDAIKEYYGGNFSGNSGNASGNDCQKKVVEAAMKQLGKPYWYGHAGPDYFDCSGFAYYSYKIAGYSAVYGSRTSAKAGAVEKGKIVDGNPNSNAEVNPNYSKLRPGDLVFFNNDRPIGHTGIYIGNGKFIESAGGKKCQGRKTETSCQVKISELTKKRGYNGARRVC